MAVAVLGGQGKTDILCSHSQLGLERKVLLVFCADIGTDLAVPALIRTLDGIAHSTGQVVNVVNLCSTVAAFVGRVHLNGCAIVEINNFGTQSIAGQVAIGIVRFADYHAILFHIQVLTGSDAIGQNIHQADFQFPGTLH